MCLFHKWTPWEQYKEKRVFHSFKSNLVTQPYLVHLQKRVCKKCNLTQIMKVEEQE